MNPSILQEITLFQEFLNEHQDIGIVIGSHQTLDTIAASLSLFLSLSQRDLKVQIVSKKEPTVEVSNLVGIDKIRSNFVGNTTKLVVSLPYIKGEVEKVLFTEQPNFINFHLTAAEGRNITSFNTNDVKLSWEGGAPKAIITVGVGNIDEISSFLDTQSAKIVNIDNYQGNSRFGDVVIVDEAFSSLSEIVGKIIKDSSMPFDQDIAQNILDGVLFATRNFTKNNTSPIAFEVASSAMYQGAQRRNEERGFNQPRNQGQRGQGQENRNLNRQRVSNFQVSRVSSPAPRVGTPASPRVSDNDFPAMHMRQNNASQNQNENPRVLNNRGNESSQRQRSAPQNNDFNNVDDIRNRISEEDARSQNNFSNQQQNEPQDQPMPQNPSFDTQNNEDVPDDWLMPKVFKSSKNNN
jgi:nanoRNase/pAp phosphatase (c-di-AMP/oligoRNAs hydrolase)